MGVSASVTLRAAIIIGGVVILGFGFSWLVDALMGVGLPGTFIGGALVTLLGLALALFGVSLEAE